MGFNQKGDSFLVIALLSRIYIVIDLNRPIYSDYITFEIFNLINLFLSMDRNEIRIYTHILTLKTQFLRIMSVKKWPNWIRKIKEILRSNRTRMFSQVGSNEVMKTC